MKNSIEKLNQILDELYRTQQARLDVGADDLDIREEIAEVEEEIKKLQDETMEENSIKNERSSIEEDIKILENWLEELNELFKNTHINNTKERKALEHILSDYKRVLKENEQLNKKVDLMENYMVENGWEICFDNIYAELNNCNGMERDWCRGDELEKQDIHKYFSKKLLESEE